MNTPDHDPVSRPKHYTGHPSGVECIQITEHMGFSLGNAMKYIWRCDIKKDAIEDLKKARWYIDREIQKREAHNEVAELRARQKQRTKEGLNMEQEPKEKQAVCSSAQATGYATRFAYDEVKGALCQACRFGVPDNFCDRVWTHAVNGVSVKCDANAWRTNHAVLSKAFPPSPNEAAERTAQR